MYWAKTHSTAIYEYMANCGDIVIFNEKLLTTQMLSGTLCDMYRAFLDSSSLTLSFFIELFPHLHQTEIVKYLNQLHDLGLIKSEDT